MRLFGLPGRRSRLARSPFVFWLGVGGLAFLTASVVAGAIGQARSLSARYGPLEPVVVASRPVERGAALAPADVTVELVPGGFVPRGAFRAVDAVAGRTAVVPLVEGSPVLAGHLAPDGLSGVAALLPVGTRAVTVPADGSSTPKVDRGDVVDVGEDSVTVAVRPEEAKSVAYALANGSVTLALTPGPGSGPAAQRNRVASSPSTAAPAATR